MSRSKSNKPETEEEQTNVAAAVVYPREALIKSKALAGYQRDFVSSVLTKSEYTIEDAISLLDAAMKEEA